MHIPLLGVLPRKVVHFSRIRGYPLKLKNLRTFTHIEVDKNKKFKFFYGSRRIDKGIYLHVESDQFGWYLLEVHMQGNLVGRNLSRR